MNQTTKTIVVTAIIIVLVIIICILGFLLWQGKQQSDGLSYSKGYNNVSNINFESGGDNQNNTSNNNVNTLNKISNNARESLQVDPELVYENKKYGFRLIFPESWRGFMVQEGITFGTGRGVEIGFPPQSDMYVVEVLTHDEWDERKKLREAGEIPGGDMLLAKNKNYIYVRPFGYEAMEEVKKQWKDIDKIHFEFIDQDSSNVVFDKTNF